MKNWCNSCLEFPVCRCSRQSTLAMTGSWAKWRRMQNPVASTSTSKYKRTFFFASLFKFDFRFQWHFCVACIRDWHWMLFSSALSEWPSTLWTIRPTFTLSKCARLSVEWACPSHLYLEVSTSLPFTRVDRWLESWVSNWKRTYVTELKSGTPFSSPCFSRQFFA